MKTRIVALSGFLFLSTFGAYLGFGGFDDPLAHAGGPCVAVATSQAYASGTTNTADVTSIGDYRGATFFENVSATAGTSPTCNITIQEKDPTSGNYLAIPGASFPQENGAVTVALQVYPGVSPSANAAVSLTIPQTYRAQIVVGGSSSPTCTLTLTACYGW